MTNTERAEKIAASWLDQNETELNKLIVAAITSQLDVVVKETEERMYLHGESKSYKAYNEGFAAAREKAAEIARETNLNVHPDCGYAISHCIRAMTP